MLPPHFNDRFLLCSSVCKLQRAMHAFVGCGALFADNNSRSVTNQMRTAYKNGRLICAEDLRQWLTEVETDNRIMWLDVAIYSLEFVENEMGFSCVPIHSRMLGCDMFDKQITNGKIVMHCICNTYCNLVSSKQELSLIGEWMRTEIPCEFRFHFRNITEGG